MNKGLSLILALVLGAIFLSSQASAAGTMKADYRFQNTLASAAGTAPALTNLGPGSNTFGNEAVSGVTGTVLKFPDGNGLSLTPTTGVIPSDRYTISVLFRFESLDGYRKIVDFKNGTADPGLYSYSGILDFYNGAEATTATITANTYVRVVMTRDSAKNVVGYVNGVRQFSFTDSSDLAVIDPSNTLRFFVDDTHTESEHSGGAIANLQLYDDALTASEVAALGAGSGSVATSTVTPTTTVTPTATTSAPAAGQAGMFVTTPGGSNAGCPSAGQWLGSYWNGTTSAISDAVRSCSGADRVWVRRGAQWLGYSPDAPGASDAFSVQSGEFAFIHGR